MHACFHYFGTYETDAILCNYLGKKGGHSHVCTWLFFAHFKLDGRETIINVHMINKIFVN
jgi:hypothetical protein